MGPEITIFLDPPYEKHDLYLELIKSIDLSSALGIELWIESDTQKGPSLDNLGLEAFSFKNDKLITQGSHFLGVFSKEVL